MIRFQCECGKKLVAKDTAAGKRVRCPACKKVVLVPAPKPADDGIRLVSEPQPAPEPMPSLQAEEPPAEGGPAPSSEALCPHCRVPLGPGAVLCTTCGFDLRIGKTFERPKALAERIPWRTVRTVAINLALLGAIAAAGMWAINRMGRKKDEEAPAAQEAEPQDDAAPAAAERRKSLGPLPLIHVRTHIRKAARELPDQMTLRYTDGPVTASKAVDVLREKIQREAVDSFMLKGHRVAANGQPEPRGKADRLVLDVDLELDWAFEEVGGRLVPRAPYVTRCSARLAREGKKPIWDTNRPYRDEAEGRAPRRDELAALAQLPAVHIAASLDRCTDRVAARLADETFEPRLLPEPDRVHHQIVADRTAEARAAKALATIDKTGDLSGLEPLLEENNQYLLQGLADRIDKVQDPAVLLAIARAVKDPDAARRAAEAYIKMTGEAPVGATAAARQLSPQALLLGVRKKFIEPKASLKDELSFLRSAAKSVPHLVLAFARTAAQIDKAPEVQEAYRALVREIETRRPAPQKAEIDGLAVLGEEEASHLLGREALFGLLRSGYFLAEQTVADYLHKVAAGTLPALEDPWPDGTLRLAPVQMTMLEELQRVDSQQATDAALALLLRVGGEQRERVRQFVQLPKCQSKQVLRMVPTIKTYDPDKMTNMLVHDTMKGDRMYPILDVIVDTYYRYRKEKVDPRYCARILYFSYFTAKNNLAYGLTLFAMLDSPDVAERRAGAEGFHAIGAGGTGFIDDLRARLKKETDPKTKSLLQGAIQRAVKAGEIDRKFRR
jgi:hypothetical protein